MGDIHGEGSDADSVATANAVDAINPTAILGLGDYQYTTGTCANFTTSGHYNSDWGREQSRMYPTLGPTHDYDGTTTGSNAAGYFNGTCAGQSVKAPGAALAAGGTLQWNEPYSFNLGAWHVIQLPSACYRYTGCDAATISSWLANDLAADTHTCELAYWHEPYWTSPTSEHTSDASMRAWTQILYDHGVDLILNGHQHYYERFLPQNMSSVRDDAHGITENIVGTGGISHYTKTSTAANEAAYNDATYGVMRLILSATGYSTQFVPVEGGTFADASSGTCHGAPVPTPTPTGTPAPTATPVSGTCPTTLAGFTLRFCDQFDYTGALPASRYFFYPNTWHDTSGLGTYDPSAISAHDGMADIHISTSSDGVHHVAALVPLVTVNTARGDQLYGAYEIRFRADVIRGYKGAWLLWPQSGTWPRDGEIDFPEGNFDGAITAFMHHQGATSSSDQDAFPTSATWQVWHTARTEWTPSAVRFYLDGGLIGTSTTRIPNTPMHWVIQNETNLDGVPIDPSVQGHVFIDYVEAWSA